MKQRIADLPKADPCSEVGCDGRTTGRKPFCIVHLARLPYAARVAAEIKARAEEEQRARRWRSIDVAGSRAKEIVECVAWKGVVSPKRLAVEMDMRPDKLDGYLAALSRAGIVSDVTVGSLRGAPRRIVYLKDRREAS